MSDELVKQETELAVPDGAWGAADEFTPDDFLISKALLMQPLSELVINKAAEGGEYRDSISGELYGSEAEGPFEALVFHRDMTWVIFEDGKYKETVRCTDENRDWPIVEGKIERNKTFNFYCLPVTHVERADVVPVVVSLKRTGLRTAKGLQTHFRKLRAMNKPSVEKVINFTAIKRSNDKGTFYVAGFSEGRESKPEEKAVAFRWYTEMKAALATGKARVDDSDEAAKGKRRKQEDDSDVPF